MSRHAPTRTPEKNRRKHSRVRGQGVSGHLKHEGEVLLGLPIENLSMGGMLLRSTAPLPMGSTIQVEVSRPRMKSLKMTGRVIGVAPAADPSPETGTHAINIRFNLLEADVGERLEKLIFDLSAVELPPAPETDPRAETPSGRVKSAKGRERSADFDFDFGTLDPLVSAPRKRRDTAVQVPPSANLTGEILGVPLDADDLHRLLDEKEKELTEVRAQLHTSQQQLGKMQRLVAELKRSLTAKP